MNDKYTADLSLLLGQRLKALRKKQGLSQEKLANMINLDRTYVAGIEVGKRNPTIKSLGKIASGLNCSLFDLFNTEEFKNHDF